LEREAEVAPRWVVTLGLDPRALYLANAPKV
jgi:hypothetical protein